MYTNLFFAVHRLVYSWYMKKFWYVVGIWLFRYKKSMWKSLEWLKLKILVYKLVYGEIWYKSGMRTKKDIYNHIPTFFCCCGITDACTYSSPTSDMTSSSKSGNVTSFQSSWEYSKYSRVSGIPTSLSSARVIFAHRRSSGVSLKVTMSCCTVMSASSSTVKGRYILQHTTSRILAVMSGPTSIAGPKYFQRCNG